MKLPPLHALMCFEAAARLMSMKKAAEELCVTPSAISQQIAKLEVLMQVRLFIRSPRYLSLTPQGRDYLQAIQPAFERIAFATQRMTAAGQRNSVTLSCTSGFATQWLLPRLAHFEQLYPDIEVRISTSNRQVDLLTDGIDFAVRHGLGDYPDLKVERLINDHLIPVCSPALLAGGVMHSPADVANYRLLHDEHRLDWALWFKAAGYPQVDTAHGPVFIDSNAVVEAALAGKGIALLRQALVARELAQGTLLSPFPTGLASTLAYYLVYDGSALLQRSCCQFRDWLLKQATQTSAVMS